MHSLLGVVLSLAVSWGPTNGFDPTSVYLLWDGAQYMVDGQRSVAFDQWLARDPTNRVPAVGYFVACAFDEGVVIKSGSHSWTGALGLAPSLQALLGRLRDSSKSKPKTSAQLVPFPDDGKWVSACLMALANEKGSHQYVQLRGNPPAWPTGPSEAELWTMGYPEGVFFADLLNFNVVPMGGTFIARAERNQFTKDDLERSFTLSLNLPKGYSRATPLPWAPPNGSTGRTYDFDEVTRDSVKEIGRYRVAENLGTFAAASKKLVATAHRHDPIYDSEYVCVAPRSSGSTSHPGHPGTTEMAATPAPPGALPTAHAGSLSLEIPRQIIACDRDRANALRPIFVHGPRLVGLASATNTIDPALVIQAIDTGDSPLMESPAPGAQRQPCAPAVTCTGPFQLHSAGQPPVPPPTDAKAETLVNLGENQSVTVVLRRDRTKNDPLASGKERFTAIVRFQTKGNTTAKVEVSRAGGGMRTAGEAWPDLPSGTPEGWKWMQVYPVHVAADGLQSDGKLALKIKISGPSGGPTPQLDVAGFVSGPPWCHKDASRDFMGVCPDDPMVVPLMRSALPRRASGPQPTGPAIPVPR